MITAMNEYELKGYNVKQRQRRYFTCRRKSVREKEEKRSSGTQKLLPLHQMCWTTAHLHVLTLPSISSGQFNRTHTEKESPDF